MMAVIISLQRILAVREKEKDLLLFLFLILSMWGFRFSKLDG
jgi:hypothetical protein